MERVRAFVSASSHEAARARWAIESLEATGLIRVEDRWPYGAEAWAKRDRAYSREQQAEYAEGHEAFIKRARLFWLLFPRDHSDGALYELGFANAHREHVGDWWLWSVATGADVTRTITTSRCNYRDTSDELGLVECARRAAEIVRSRSADTVAL